MGRNPSPAAQATGTFKGKVILSGYPGELYNSLYKDWERAERDSIADGRLPRKEVLWFRNIETGIFG
jgi:hypothetical protein